MKREIYNALPIAARMPLIRRNAARITRARWKLISKFARDPKSLTRREHRKMGLVRMSKDGNRLGRRKLMAEVEKFDVLIKTIMEVTGKNQAA